MRTLIADKLRTDELELDDFAQIREECVASQLAKANRIVSRIFEESFRDENISSPQFAMLVAVLLNPDTTASELSESLSTDPSTVSRNTDVLSRRGLLDVAQGSDRRVRTYRLTAQGEAMVKRCAPHWRAAQRRALRQLGRSNWWNVRRALQRLSA